MSSKPPYNPKDKKSVIYYDKLLKGKTLKEICEPQIYNEGKGFKLYNLTNYTQAFQ